MKNTQVKFTSEELDSQRSILESRAHELIDERSEALEGPDAEEFDSITGKLTEIRTELDARAVREKAMIELYKSGSFERGTPFDYPEDGTTHRGNSERDIAMRALDGGVTRGELQGFSAERVEALLTNTSEGSWVARWASAAGDPAYRSAFGKLIADEQRGHLNWTAAESEAYRRVSAVQAEQRAMSTTGNQGGFMLPISVDPAINITNDGSANPIRQLAKVVQVVGGSYRGITSAGVTAEWIGEGLQVADASPVLAQPIIPLYKGDAFVPFSYEVEDGINFLPELQKLLADGLDQLQANAFTTGTGVGQPTGFVTGLVAAGGSSVVVGAGEALTAADLYTLQASLGARFQPLASWVAALATINGVRQFETANGSAKFPELVSGQLLGRKISEVSNMDATVNAAATAANYLVAYGDWKAGYLIADRIGSTLEIISNLMGANGRPTGQRGAMLWTRTGGNVVVPQALRLLNVATAA